MILSKSSEHTIRILSYFALHENEIYSASFLSRELGIPFKYLTKLLTLLAKGGYLEPTKGRIGGFRLVRDPASVYIYEILETIDEYDGYEKCVLGFAVCDEKNPCALHEKWKLIREDINSMLKNTTLKEFRDIPNIKI